MSIPFDFPSVPDYSEYCKEIRDIWGSRQLTHGGPKYKQLQSDLEKYLGCPHIVLYTNGHLALENVIAAMNFPKGGEVITTPFTFISTTHAIVRNNLVPVFCDVDPDNLTIDASKLEGLITEKTVAIVPVHVYGRICDVDAIENIAKKYSLKVIYDAAHAFGVKYKGISSANFGDASMFSFQATKVFNTFEGGAVCISDGSIVELLNELKNFGITGHESIQYVGGNAKMSELHAAVGICNLRHLEEEIARRKKAAMHYDERLSGVNGIRIPAPQRDVESNYAYYPVFFDGFQKSRDEVFEELGREQIAARKYFYPITNSFACYKNLPTADANKTPVAKYLGDTVLALPLYADLSLADTDKICDIILR